MPYDPKAIANYLLEIADAQGEPLSPLKIQKLVYFANGWYLAITDAPLLDEQVEAWAYGPVIPSLYRAFQKYGDQAVTGPAVSPHFKVVADADGGFSYQRVVPTIGQSDQQDAYVKELLRRIWEIYGRYTAIQLSNLTHQSGTPWHRVFVQYNGEIPRGTDIPAEWIKDYFQTLARSKTTQQ
jgi:uncharacterized phage-associated protein